MYAKSRSAQDCVLCRDAGVFPLTIPSSSRPWWRAQRARGVNPQALNSVERHLASYLLILYDIKRSAELSHSQQ